MLWVVLCLLLMCLASTGISNGREQKLRTEKKLLAEVFWLKTQNWKPFWLFFFCFGIKDKKKWYKLQILWEFKNTLMSKFFTVTASALYICISFSLLNNNKKISCVVKDIVLNIIEWSLTFGTHKLQYEKPCWGSGNVSHLPITLPVRKSGLW